MLNAKGDLDVVELQKRLNARRKELYGRPEAFKTKKSFAPSNLGFVGQCPRHWYYAFSGGDYKDKFDPKSSAAMENGKDAHLRIQREYREEFGARTEVEVRHDDPPVFGFADVILELDGIEAVGDIKTIKDEKFRRLEATMTPDAGNWLQVLIYMYILGIDNGFLHYESKSSHEELFFPFSMTPRALTFVESTLAWMRTVRTNALHGELPARPFEKTDYHCKYCPVFGQCWKDEPGNLQIPILKLDKP